jgi:hypothetical protein
VCRCVGWVVIRCGWWGGLAVRDVWWWLCRREGMAVVNKQKQTPKPTQHRHLTNHPTTTHTRTCK